MPNLLLSGVESGKGTGKISNFLFHNFSPIEITRQKTARLIDIAWSFDDLLDLFAMSLTSLGITYSCIYDKKKQKILICKLYHNLIVILNYEKFIYHMNVVIDVAM